MSVCFQIKGRLGNALFRYLGCSLFCIKYEFKFNINRNTNNSFNDDDFIKFIRDDTENKNITPQKTKYLFDGYYQHDMIYRKYKEKLFEYMKRNPEHFILTDGINAGDRRHEKFYIKDILNTPSTFNKFYDLVIHIRLGDKINTNHTLKQQSIKDLIKKLTIPINSCIVVETLKNEYERNFIEKLKIYIKKLHGLDIKIESNDILTDYYIMKNAKILICSVSTISWFAAFISDKIEKCYMPDYPQHINSVGYCKYPIENTELYPYI